MPGEVVEQAKTRELFENPRHPYTRGLMDSIPDINVEVNRLQTLEGLVPSLYDMPSGCRFGPRCGYHCEECDRRILLTELGEEHKARCRRIEE